jgi:tetratricopeptide (TPR) repeat protein
LARPSTFRVFISAVSGELGSYRREVARVLRRKGLEVRDQEHFSQGPATLLERLRDYIQQCDAVVLLVGERYGAFPTDEHAQALGPVPSFDEYRRAKGQPQASYTQWEFLLARHFDKSTYTFVTDGRSAPDRPSDEASELGARQQAYREWIELLGLHRGLLTTPAKLIEDVLVLKLPDLGRPKPISLPYPSLGTLFKGRAGFLEELRTSLERSRDGRATAIVGRALHGLGGVGKTRLAVEYVWQHMDDYSALLFVSAERPQDLRRNMAALCGPLVLDLPEQDTVEQEARVAAALRWLAEHPMWFLILDNLDTPEAATAAEELLARLRGGHVVLTSRLSQWSGSVEPLELDVLAGEDAAQFLLERTERGRRKLPTDTADAAELARELGGLALALEQAGAYVVQRRLSLAAYLENWRGHVAGVKEWHDERVMKYPRSVAVTWQTTIEQLGNGEMALLRLLAWMAPEPLPLFVLEAAGAEARWQQAVGLLGQGASTFVPLFDALATLSSYSMVRWDTEEQSVSVHRLVQEILRARVPEAHRRDWLTLTLWLLDGAWPGDPQDVRTWQSWDLLRPHVALAVAHADRAGNPEPTGRLLGALGQLLKGKALHAEAEPLMRRVLAIDEASHGPAHPSVARDLSSVALLLKDTGRHEEAERLMRRALAIDEAHDGSDDRNVATDLSNLALLLKDTGRHEEAERLMRRALGIDDGSNDPHPPDVARDLSNLGLLLKDMGRLEEAEPLLRRALAIDRPDDPNVATALSNLAWLLKDTNRHEEAEPLMRRALAIDEASLSSDDPSVARDLNSLALLLKDTRRLEEAERLMWRALAIDKARFGLHHPNVATDLNGLAWLLKDANRLEDAEELDRRALAIDEASYGPDHPKVATDLNNLALLLKDTDRLAEAEPLMRRHVQIVLRFARDSAHPPQYVEDALLRYADLLSALGHKPADIGPILDALRREH